MFSQYEERLNRSTGVLFLLVSAFCLIPLFAGKFFVTGDGPCHLYNSAMLKDQVNGTYSSFYAQAYTFHPEPNPNWFSHAALAAFLAFLPPHWAEKSLLALYAVLFLFGLFFLLRQWYPGKEAAAFLLVPFLYQHTFLMGFFNFSLSIAGMFWIAGLLKRWQGNAGVLHMLVFASLTTLLFFVHPVGWMFSLVLALLIWVWGSLIREGVPLQHRSMLKLIAGFVPGFLLLVFFFLGKGTAWSPNPDPFLKLWNDLRHLTTLVALRNAEESLADIYAWVLIALGVWAIAERIKRKGREGADVFGFMAIISLLLYFFQPATLAGAGILSIRLQVFPWLFFILWLGSSGARFFRPAAMLCGTLFTLLWLTPRIPVHARASAAVEDYLKIEPAIEPQSVVVPLHFSFNGNDTQGMIGERIWLFMHSGDYLGAYKPLILLGNYEAGLKYFPFRWKEEVNPFVHLSGDGGGIENQPPCVRVKAWEQSSGLRADYVITSQQDAFFTDHPCSAELKQLLETSYSLKAVSPSGTVKLWQRRH